MERKLNVWVVVGKGKSFRLLDVLNGLSDNFEIHAAVFLDDLFESSFLTDIKINSYVEDAHLPGFLFGVEEDISRADLVIACEFNDEVTLQVTRFCRARKKPFIIFVNGEKSIKEALGFHSDLLKDCIDSADGFLAVGENTAEYLKYLGVDSSRVFTIQPGFYGKKYLFQESFRKKFRNYIGVSEEDFLILCEDDLDSAQCFPFDLIMCIKSLYKYNEIQAKYIKIIFTGNGSLKEKLKYLAVDLGVSKNVMFISQEVRSFKRDLYCGSECLISIDTGCSEAESTSDLWSMFDGIVSGLIPIINSSHPLAASIGMEFSYLAGSYQDLAKMISGYYVDRPVVENRSHASLLESRRVAWDLNYNLKKISDFLLQRIDLFYPKYGSLYSSFVEWIRSLKKSIGSKLASELIEELNLEIDKWAHQPDALAQINLFKGQLLLKEGDLDQAMGCFELSTANEETEREAYLGLGKIAYISFSNEEALTFYRKALALKPNDPDAMSGLGFVYRKSGLADEAVHWLGKSLSVDPENNNILFALTQASLEAEDTCGSISMLEHLKMLLGDKASLIMALGQLYYRVGENEKGSMLVTAALELAEENVSSSLQVISHT